MKNLLSIFLLFSYSQVFAQDCLDGEGSVAIIVIADTYVSQETSYILTGDNGFSFNYDFTNDDNTDVITYEFCIPNGTNMSFVLSDENGDGLVPPSGYEIQVCDQSLTGQLQFISSNSVTHEFQVMCGDVFGCTDPYAYNYDTDATFDDGSCEDFVFGCTDSTAFNFDSLANTDDGSCVAVLLGCKDPNSFNYDVLATTDDNSCIDIIYGCTDTAAFNYDSDANTDDGSCDYESLVIIQYEELDGSNFHFWAIINELPTVSFLRWGMGDGTEYQNVDEPTHYFQENGTYQVSVNVYSSSGIYFATATVVVSNVVSGCMDENAVNFDPLATADDGSCLYPGCTDFNALNYDSNANTDDGSCCYDSAVYSLFNLATNETADGTYYIDIESYAPGQITEIEAVYDNSDAYTATISVNGIEYPMGFNGCLQVEWSSTTGEPYYVCDDIMSWYYGIPVTPGETYSWTINIETCSGGQSISGEYTSPIYGCTDSTALNFDTLATTNDESCLYPNYGCTDSTALNFDSLATENDSSCEYDLIGADCSISFTYINTGVNASIFINENAGGLLNVGDSIGVFYTADDGSYKCAGTSAWQGGTTQIVAFGDDATTNEKDGLASGDPYLILAQSGDNIYLIEPLYVSGSMGSYVVNDISMIIDMEFTEFSCEVHTVEGCTDSNADNFNSNANFDDGSCLYSGCTDSNADNYNSTATDDDGSCIYYGCTDFNADNYDPLSNSDDGSCIYLGCTNSDYLEYWNYNWVSSDGLTYYYLLTPLNELVNQDDGSCNTQIVQGCVDPNFMEYNPQSNIFDMDLCQTIIVRGCMDETAFNFSIIANTDDGSCYPVIEGCMDQSAFNYVQPTGDVLVDINTNNNEMCVPVIYGCLDSLAYNFNDYDGDGEYNELTGIPTVDVNTDDGSCIERVYGCLDNDYIEYNDLANTDNGSCDVLLSVAYSEVTQQNINLYNTIEEATTSLSSLQQALDTWNTTIDLSAGWNIIGYGCPSSINVADGLSNHTESIIITKANNGNVYMPEFGFNGIGDFTPGYGYQIKLTEAIEGFSLCDWYVNDIPEDNIVSLQEENASLHAELDSLYGCIDETSCNFDSTAFVDDGSCLYPEQGYDCEGNVISHFSLSFDDYDDRVELPYINIGNQFILSVDVKISDNLDFGEIINIGGNFTLMYDSEKIKVNIGDTGNNSAWHFGDNYLFYETNETDWINILVSYYQDSLSLYYNGLKLVNEYCPGYSIDGLMIVGDRNFNSNASYRFGGNIDNIIIWDSVITEFSSFSDFCDPLSISNQPVLHWTFEEGNDNLVNDLSGNGNIGQIFGAIFSDDVPQFDCD